MKLKNLGTVTAIGLLLMNASSFACEHTEDSEKKKILVVGGGLAGLTTAYRLKQQGFEVTLLEGRQDRLGGRAYTHTFNDGSYVELGGEFIDHDHKAIQSLAKELDVELYDDHIAQDIRALFGDQELSPKDILEKLKKASQDIETYLNSQPTLVSYKTHNTFVYNPISDCLTGIVDHHSLQILKASIVDEYGQDETCVASGVIYSIKNKVDDYISYLDHLQSFWGSSWFGKKITPYIDESLRTYRIKGGNKMLIQALEKAVGSHNIVMDRKLKVVTKKGEDLKLTFEDHDENRFVIKTEKLVLATPFSTLRHVHLDENLALPELTREAIRTLPYGTNAKLVFPLEKAISKEGFHIFDCSQFSSLWGNQDGQMKSCATFYYGGSQGMDNFQDQSTPISTEIEYRKAILRKAFPKAQIDTSRPIVGHSWGKDPFAQGSYSFMGQGVNYNLWNESAHSSYKGMRAWAEPVHNILFFAGEHTQTWSGFMNSAVQSGNKAAELLSKSF
jgi:monoamine oxidase